ncbi:MAG TPA: Fur family transcriptional regulator [Acidimicrobiales bacterium]|nr:Fur family transcriptional regulator [Acidimicrobiales bacterium]
MKDPDALVELLRRRGLRATPQRRAIVDAVRAGGGHVTADSVFQSVRAGMPTISLKTVYETLHSLVAVGELTELTVGGQPARYDTTVRPHHHLICLDCSRIEDVDFHMDAPVAGQRPGFSIVHTDVVAWGRCQDCQALAGGGPEG